MRLVVELVYSVAAHNCLLQPDLLSVCSQPPTLPLGTPSPLSGIATLMMDGYTKVMPPGAYLIQITAQV